MDNSGTIIDVTVKGMVVNLLLAVFKCFAGVFGGSQAVLADGIHSFSDLVSDVIILVGVKIWNKPADSDHPHGHGRYEILVTLSVGIMLACAGAVMLAGMFNGKSGVQKHEPEWICFWVAFGSILVKEILFRWTVAHGRKIGSMPLIANAWHHRSDAFSSIPAAISVLAAILVPGFVYADKIGAAIVSLFILFNAYKLMIPAWNKLMGAGAPDSTTAEILTCASKVEGVMEVHKVRTQYIGAMTISVDLHVEVDPHLKIVDAHNIAGAVKHSLIKHVDGVVDVIVHVEPHQAKS